MHALAGAGRVIGGRYRLRDLIGRGAMGAVWRARDELLDRDVAVKEVRVPPALSEHDRSALYQRTLREAKTAARLNHPGVVTVFDVVDEDGRPWIVMELVRARSLDQVLASGGPLPVSRAADIGHQLVSALATAHAAGVLHRDVKPSNVLLAPDGRAVLTDFGIATFEGDERLTQTGMVMGTPEFTPPERIRGEPATPSSDLWSLGATLYAAVQGRGPYQARGGAITTMNAVLHEDAPAAPSAGQLGPVIAALMLRDPAARPDAARASELLSGARWETGPAGGRGMPPAFSVAAVSGAGVPPPTSWDQPALSPDQSALPPDHPGSWPAADAAPPRTPSGSPIYGAPVSQARPGAPGDPPGYRPPSDIPAYSSRGPAMYAAPVSDALAYTSGASPFPSAPVSDAPPYSAGGRARFGARVGDAPAGSGGGSSFSAAPAGNASRPTVSRRARTGAAGVRRAGGGRASRRGGRGVLTACAALVIVAAGVYGGLTVARGSHGSPQARPAGPGSGGAATLPAGFAWYSVSPASAGTTAGFRLAVPRGWTASTKGLTTYLRDPAGVRFMEVDLTRHTFPAAIAEARWLEVQTNRQGKFPSYRRVSIRPVRVSGSAGAVWSFTWLEAGAGRVFAQDYLFDLNTARGSQSYAVYASAPAASWRQTTQMLADGDPQLPAALLDPSSGQRDECGVAYHRW